MIRRTIKKKVPSGLHRSILYQTTATLSPEKKKGRILCCRFVLLSGRHPINIFYFQLWSSSYRVSVCFEVHFYFHIYKYMRLYFFNEYYLYSIIVFYDSIICNFVLLLCSLASKINPDGFHEHSFYSIIWYHSITCNFVFLAFVPCWPVKLTPPNQNPRR